MTIYEMLEQLKKDLIEHYDSGELHNPKITAQQLHAIRTVLNDGEIKYKKENEDHFIDRCHDFKSVYNYLHSKYVDDHYDKNNQLYYNFESVIESFLDPLLNEVVKNDYEVMISRVEISKDATLFRHDMLLNMQKIENAYSRGDFATVNTMSSTLLQNVYKEICEKNDIPYAENEKFPQLLLKTKDAIKLNPREHEDKDLRKFAEKINSICTGLNELRNIYSSSHGTSSKNGFNNLPPHHYKLILDSTKSIANFLCGSYMYQENKKENN